MKTQKTRILFVEDVEADVVQASGELQKGGIDLSWVRAETRVDFQKKFNDFKPDIVICNYSIPAFNGIKALETTITTTGNVPVILYAGPINEEAAVACMKAGATDYVLKSNKKRLAYAVKHALVQKEMYEARDEAEQVLLDNENRYRSLFESTTDAVFLKDEEFKYILVNNAIQTFLDNDKSKIIGKTDYDLMPNDIATRLRHSDTKAILNKTLVINREKIGNRTFELRKFPVILNNGQTGVGGILHKITTLKTDTPAWLQDVTSYYPTNAMVISDNNGAILSVNPAFTQLTGYTSEEALGKNSIDLLKSNIQNEDFYNNIWNTLQAGEVWHGEMTNRRKDGSICNEEVTITPMLDTQGTVTQFITIRQDITDRKITEIPAESREWNYLNLVNNSNIGLYTSTLHGKLLQVNETFCRMLEYNSAGKLLENSIFSLFKHPEKWRMLKESIMSNGNIMNFEVDLVTTRGNDRNVIINAILENNMVKGMVLDLSKQKKAETELIMAKLNAEENEKLKTSFLSIMSHDVRIPINAIQGFVGLLTTPDITDYEKVEFVNLISKSSQQLLKMMNDFVELSKAVTGEITSNPVSFELNQLIKDVYREYFPAAKRKNLKFNYYPGLPDNESRIRFDDQKLRHVITNLLDNAIKFTDTGEVNFGYEMKNLMLELYVKDTGKGISYELQKVIFDRFRKFDDPYTRKNEGSGLGLPTAIAYIEFLGGKIRLDSEPGKGSNFVFTIPFIPVTATVTPVQETHPAEMELHKRKILVAEDDETNFMFMERLLSKTNATILRAVNGQEAVDRCAADSSIDLVLMDINMPFMNGLEATRIIKSKTPGLPIIAVTAYSLSDDRETCIAAGCDEYIPKPIHREELFMKLNSCLTN